MTTRRRILVTSPPAPAMDRIHLGNLVTRIQTDIWVRFQAMMGHQCIHISAECAHGRDIMVKAEHDGISVEELIEATRRDHVRDFTDFGIRYDNFYTTHASENRFYLEETYNRCVTRGRIADHRFFQLSKCTGFLGKWIRRSTISDDIRNQLVERLDDGLQDVDISCDTPCLGFEIPGDAKKCFSCQLDSLVGYMASFDELSDTRRDLAFATFWDRGAATELHHFVSKEDIDLHALIWPALLDSAGRRTPTGVHSHGSLDAASEILASTFLTHFRSDDLRYYYAIILDGTTSNMDFSLADFEAAVNSELVDGLAGLAGRCAAVINTRFENRLADSVGATDLIESMVQKGDVIAQLMEATAFSKATREIAALADLANQYVDVHISEDSDDESALHAVCTDGINMFRLLVIYLKPIVPAFAARAESYLNVQPLRFVDRHQLLTRHYVHTFEPLLAKIEKSRVEAMIVSQ